MGSDSMLKDLWHHQDAILCCSLKVIVYVFSLCSVNVAELCALHYCAFPK